MRAAAQQKDAQVVAMQQVNSITLGELSLCFQCVYECANVCVEGGPGRWGAKFVWLGGVLWSLRERG